MTRLLATSLACAGFLVPITIYADIVQDWNDTLCTAA
jgi:hypothetical protein